MRQPEQIYPVSHYDPTEIPAADAWFWQIGNRWLAVVDAHGRATWWDEDDESQGVYEDAGRPGDGTRPIGDAPTSGTLVYRIKDSKGVLHEVVQEAADSTPLPDVAVPGPRSRPSSLADRVDPQAVLSSV